MYYEMKNKQKQIEKEQKLAQFQSRTKANIMRKKREEAQSKPLTESEQKKKLARENALKAKQFSQQHRKIVAQKGVSISVKSKSGSIQASASKSEFREGSDSGYGHTTQMHKQLVEQSHKEGSAYGIVSIEGS